MTNSKQDLRKKIKAIVHPTDMPDHFMSDEMLAKPDKLLELLTSEIKAALTTVQADFPKERRLTEVRKRIDSHNYENRNGWNQAIKRCTKVLNDKIKELE